MPGRRSKPASEDAASSLRGPASSILPYIPKRYIPDAADRRRDLTLQAGFIPPCLPMTAPVAPSGDLWLHEIKLDGFRIIARNDGTRVTLYSRSGDDLTQRYPLIVGAMAGLPYCTIDGEAVACDESGVASFDLLRRGLRDDHVVLYAFDLLEQAAGDRRRDALAHRKADLDLLVANAGPGLLAIGWVDGAECEGPALFEKACSLGLGGIVSKRKDARYMSGRSPYWLKMENPASEVKRRERDDDREKG